MGVRIFLKSELTKISLLVKAGSKTESIEILGNHTLRIKVRAQAKDNEANDRVIELFSEALRIPKSQIQILKGMHSKMKMIGIQGITIEEILVRFK